MKLTHDNTRREERESSPDTPGLLLKNARIAASMSTNDLATRLRMDVRLVEALESDDYATLAAPTFVKGYIRSICKELGVDSGPIVSAYDTHAFQDAPALADFVTRAPAQITSSNKFIKGVTFGIAIILTLMVGLWWHARDAGDPGDSPSETFAENGEVGQPELPDIAATPLSYTFPVVEPPVEPEFSSPADDREALADSDEVADTAGLEASPDRSQDAEPQVRPAVKDIVITTEKEAWMGITDSSDARLFYGLLKPGTEVNVSGQAPYTLVIGNAAFVTVTHRGNIIDLAPFSYQGVARLTLEDGADQEVESQAGHGRD